MGLTKDGVVSRHLVFALLIFATVAGTAFATAPGENGSIVFRRYLGPNRTEGAIFVRAVDGSGERQLTRPPAKVSDDYPDVASDGSFVAFQRCTEFACRVYRVNSDGTALRRLGPGCTGKQSADKTGCLDSSYPAISPDRARIAFTHVSGTVRHDTIAHVQIWSMTADGTGLRQITRPPTRAAEDDEAQWSPDGRRLAFQRHNTSARPKDARAVFVVDADGSGLHRVTPWKLSAGDGPDWSPDGSSILFRGPASDDFLKTNYWTVHPDGTGLHQLTHISPTTKLYSASFSPDGTKIVFGMQGVGGAADVWTMNVDGSGAQQLTHTPQWDSAPDWGGLATG